jgi:hypothetical protein
VEPINIQVNFIQKIRLYFGNRALNALLKSTSRTRKYTSFENSSKVALLYLIDEDQSVEAANLLEQLLVKSGKKVSRLGYTGNKTIPQNFTPKGGSECLCSKDLRWNLIPKPEKTGSFLSENYDILIDLSLSDLIPVKYIAVAANAGLKAGETSQQNEKIFDLLIKHETDQPISEFIDTVFQYVKIINQE